MAPRERDLLDYYLGPTGIPDRIRALNEFNPTAGIMRGMSAAGRAADSSRPPEQRRAAAGEAAMETGIAMLPIGLGRLASLFRVPSATAATSMADEAADAVETLTAYRPEVGPAPAPGPTYMTQEEIEAELDRIFGPQTAPEPPQQAPFDPNDIDFGPDIDQIAAGADPFGDINPWTNVQDAEDMAENYVPAPPSPRVLPDTAPAASIAQANPYTPTDAAFQMPRTWAEQGVAGIYSRSGRAANQLRQPRYSDIESLRKELEARGASPRELNYQINALEEDFAAGPVPREVIQDFFSSPEYDTGLMIDRTLRYADDDFGFMPQGGRNATSTVYYHPEGQNYPPGATRHYDEVENDQGQVVVPLFHSRAAQYDLGFPGGGTTHHVVEIQSDFAQFRQQIPKTAEERTEMQERVQYLEDLLDYRVNTDRGGLSREESNELERKRDVLYGFPGLLDEFDQQYDAPYVRRENDWVDAAIRQNLLDAVNSGSDWITFGNGRQATRLVGMPEAAAKSFYDTRVPRRIEDVLRRFANQSGIEAPTLERVPFVDGQEVLGMRITPEFRDALIKNGLPSYKNGGIVSLRNH